MSKAPDDPERGWISKHALKWGSVDHFAIEDGAVIGSKIPDGALDLSKLTPELQELIEQMQADIMKLLLQPSIPKADTTYLDSHAIKVDQVFTQPEPPKPKQGRPKKSAPEAEPEEASDETV